MVRARKWVIGIAVASSPVLYWLAPKAAGWADSYLKSVARSQAEQVAAPIAAAATQAAANQQAVQNAVVNTEIRNIDDRLGRIENKLDRAIGSNANGPTGLARGNN